jgi:folate-binding protein YgfZ
MNTPALWQERLTQTGNPAADANAMSDGNIMVDLTHLALVEVSGVDAEKFLASQLTSDVLALTAHQSQLSAWCSAQGRVLALLRLYRTPSAYRLLLPVELVEPTLKRLRMYVLRSRVKMEDISAQYVRLGLSGPKIAEQLGTIAGQVPVEPNAISTTVSGVLLRLPGATPRFIYVGEAEEAIMIWDKLTANTQSSGASAWTLLNIEACLPQVYAATRDEFVPQTLNLDVLGAISFNKGCYPGQEIVARLKYRGHVKQRLYPGRAQTDQLPERGSKIMVTGQEAHAGRVVDTAIHPDGGVALLAVLNIELAQSQELHLGTPTGPACRFTMPPYSLND